MLITMVLYLTLRWFKFPSKSILLISYWLFIISERYGYVRDALSYPRKASNQSVAFVNILLHAKSKLTTANSF